MTPTALELVKHFEGCKLVAYQDEGGVWTVGYGCTGPDIFRGTTWTQAYADAEVERRVRALIPRVSALLKVLPTDNELAAMVSLAFNIGMGGGERPGFADSSVLRHFNARARELAANAFLLWTNVNHAPSAGLIKRRHAERAVFLGDFSSIPRSTPESTS